MNRTPRAILLLICAGLAALVYAQTQTSKRIARLEERLDAIESAIDRLTDALAQRTSEAQKSAQPAEEPGRPAEKADAKKQAESEGPYEVFKGTVSRKGLCGAFEKLGRRGDILCAHAARILYWKLDLRRDLRFGDRIAVAYEWPKGAKEPVILALKFSGKKEIEAYRFKADGDEYPSYFDPQGVEIPARLVDSPIAGYEQITAFFGERRGRKRHLGIDFKAPVGTPVRSPFDGVVTRKNWNWRANGNSVEIKIDGKDMYAIFLHLDKIKVKVGDRVKKGDIIAASGNTGKTTAPHLHYQLDVVKNGRRRSIDPLKYHELYRKKLQGDELARFRSLAAPLRKALER